MKEYKKPAWYLTPTEFAEIIVTSLEENGYFKHNEKAHPSDIEAAFSTTASAIATSIDYIGKKIYDSENNEKKAMMESTNLKKLDSNITITPSSNDMRASTVSVGGALGGSWSTENKYAVGSSSWSKEGRKV